MSMLTNAARGIKNIWSHGDDDYDSEEDEMDGDDSAPAHSSSSTSKYSDHKYSSSTADYTPSYGGGSGAGTSRARNLRPVPIPLRAREKNIYTLRPKTQDEAAIAADYLKAGSAVVVNLETVEREVSVRIIDFMSGVCYGLEGQGHAMKLGDAIFLFTPAEFEISSDELDYGENREFFFKDVDGSQPSTPPVARPAAAQAQSTAPASAAPSSAQSAYTGSFASAYNTPQQYGSQGGGASHAAAASAPASPQSSTQSAPRAQTLPASSVYSSSGQAHVTVAGKPAPTSVLSASPRPSSSASSNVSRSWER